MSDLIPLKEPVFRNRGPREWTPRVGSNLKKVEFLRALLPEETLAVFEPEIRWDSLTGKESALVLRVRARKWYKAWDPEKFDLLEDNVWITEEGVVVVEAGIRDLLSGLVVGFEHLAGRWEKWMEVSNQKGSLRV
jgi:hypothetical protein